MFRKPEHVGVEATAEEATDPLSRRALLATLTGASAAGAAAAVGSSLISATPAAAAGTDRGMSYTVVAANAGAPFQNNGDAQCPGAADQTTINAAIALVAGLGGGTVELSDGDFSLTGSIVLASNVVVRGQGPYGTRLVRNSGSFTMVQMSGTGSGAHLSFSGISDLALSGNLGAINGIECHYTDRCIIARVFFVGFFAHAIEGVEFWDTTITDCRFDYCGSRDGSSVPAVGIYQNRPGLPSDDTCNGLHFTNCTWETFADGAIGLFGIADGKVNYCYFTNCKVETGTLRGVPVKVDWADEVNFRNFRSSIGDFENQTQPQDIFVITNSFDCIVDGYHGFCQDSGTQTVRTLLSLNNNNHMFLRNLLFQAGTINRPSVAALEFTGTNEVIDLGYHSYGYDGSGSAVLRTGTTTKKYRNSGTATVPNGATNVNVTHDLQKTPAAADIAVTPTNNLGSASKFWVNTITATTFRINVNANPGAATAKFAWQAEAY